MKQQMSTDSSASGESVSCDEDEIKKKEKDIEGLLKDTEVYNLRLLERFDHQ